MYDVDAIEAINFEQLATATDRILLRARHGTKRRSTTGPFPKLARGSAPHLTLDPYETTYVPHRREDDTIRTTPVSSRTHAIATTIVIPTLLGIAVGLAAML